MSWRLTFLDHLRSLSVYRSEDQHLLAVFDLERTIREFCMDHPGDAQCQTWLMENWLFWPLIFR